MSGRAVATAVLMAIAMQTAHTYTEEVHFYTQCQLAQNTITIDSLIGVGTVGNYRAHTGGTAFQPYRRTRNPCPLDPWGGSYGQQVFALWTLSHVTFRWQTSQSANRCLFGWAPVRRDPGSPHCNAALRTPRIAVGGRPTKRWY